jgi:hypothetical protein
VYKLRNTADHPESIEPFGLLRADDSRRPAFGAYQVVTRYLGGFQQVTRQTSGNVEIVTFQRDGQTTTVLWTWGRTPVRQTLPARSSQALLVDDTGAAQALTAISGAFVIDLPGATCSNGANCFIGGAPRLLVEAGTANPTPVPGVSPTPVITAPSPTDAPSPTPTTEPPATAAIMPTASATPTTESSATATVMPTASATPTTSPLIPDTARATSPKATATATPSAVPLVPHSTPIPADASTPATSNSPVLLLLGLMTIGAVLIAVLILRKS